MISLPLLLLLLVALVNLGCVPTTRRYASARGYDLKAFTTAALLCGPAALLAARDAWSYDPVEDEDESFGPAQAGPLTLDPSEAVDPSEAEPEPAPEIPEVLVYDPEGEQPAAKPVAEEEGPLPLGRRAYGTRAGPQVELEQVSLTDLATTEVSERHRERFSAQAPVEKKGGRVSKLPALKGGKSKAAGSDQILIDNPEKAASPEDVTAGQCHHCGRSSYSDWYGLCGYCGKLFHTDTK